MILQNEMFLEHKKANHLVIFNGQPKITTFVNQNSTFLENPISLKTH